MATQVLSVRQIDDALCDPIMVASYRKERHFVRLSFDPRDCKFALAYGITRLKQDFKSFKHDEKEAAVTMYNDLVEKYNASI